MVQQSN